METKDEDRTDRQPPPEKSGNGKDDKVDIGGRQGYPGSEPGKNGGEGSDRK